MSIVQTTLTIPFAKFQHASWSKEVNSKLDLNDIRSITVGMHGTTSEDLAKGELRVARLQYVPPKAKDE